MEKGGGELSEADLENVAGGSVTFGLAVMGIGLAAGLASSGIALLLQSRARW